VSSIPYAIPEARLERVPAPTYSCWRVGKDQVHVPRHADLPHRCVKCNAPATANRPKPRSFYWQRLRLVTMLIIVSIFIYAIVAMIVAHARARFRPPCATSTRARRTPQHPRPHSAVPVSAHRHRDLPPIHLR
jgi:hypothetical protein